jgi:hypothetical protein
VRVNIPHGPTFFFVRLFCTAESNVPAAPKTRADLMDSRIASLGTYVGSSFEAMTRPVWRNVAGLGGTPGNLSEATGVTVTAKQSCGSLERGEELT